MKVPVGMIVGAAIVVAAVAVIKLDVLGNKGSGLGKQFTYDIEKNQDLAKNLKGHLMLTTGDVDNNVHHGGTFRVAEALIRANKRFDFFIFPGQRHGYGNMGDYWFWLRAEYFAKHLLGDERTAADIMELNNHRPQTGGGGGAGGSTRGGGS